MQHELDHLDGKLYIDYLDSFDDLIPVSKLEDGGRPSRARRCRCWPESPRHEPPRAHHLLRQRHGRPAGPRRACSSPDWSRSTRSSRRRRARPGASRCLTPTPVAELAVAQGLPVRTPTWLRDAAVLAELREPMREPHRAGRLRAHHPGSRARRCPAHGALNLHPSLLPRHRGAAPVQAAILAGDAVSGVTLMRMDEGLDTGPIVAQRGAAARRRRGRPRARGAAGRMGAELLIDVAAGLAARVARGPPQARRWCHADAAAAPRGWPPGPDAAGGRAGAPGARLPALAGLVPRASTASASRSGRAELRGRGRRGRPGELDATDDGMLALGHRRRVLRLDEVQPAGKRRMSGAEYRRGRRR